MGFCKLVLFWLQSGEKFPSAESSWNHKAWPEPTCTDSILFTWEKKNLWCFSCSTRQWEPGTKPSQFSAAQNKYGDCCAPWELTGQVQKSDLSRDKAGSQGAGQQLVGNSQEKKISHFNDVTTNKTNNNDLCSSRYSSLHTKGSSSSLAFQIYQRECLRKKDWMIFKDVYGLFWTLDSS